MKIEMELAREEAIEAKDHKVKSNYYLAQKVKLEGEQKLEKLKKEIEEDLQVKSQIVEMIQD